MYDLSFSNFVEGKTSKIGPQRQRPIKDPGSMHVMSSALDIHGPSRTPPPVGCGQLSWSSSLFGSRKFKKVYNFFTVFL
uniref:Uncharacterized protein n=1 Tax=Nelumbo nucifera TaxID=4432 RepID=A0A822YPN6_NELNU|nr:TPA_asm: hypothetical protein HUJ06_005117 [Nelumbo nucifera]